MIAFHQLAYFFEKISVFARMHGRQNMRPFTKANAPLNPARYIGRLMEYCLNHRAPFLLRIGDPIGPLLKPYPSWACEVWIRAWCREKQTSPGLNPPACLGHDGTQILGSFGSIQVLIIMRKTGHLHLGRP
jgi:hypothetical protein